MSKLKSKEDVIKEFQIHEKDQGSSEVQIALLTNRINHLVEHLKRNKKDHHTRRGLIIMVSRRRRLITYLKRQNPESLAKIAKKLKLKIKD